MADALSDKTIDIIKSTVPALEKAGTAITDRMYQLLFRTDEVRDLFKSLYANKSLTVAGFSATSRQGHCDTDVRGKSAGLKILA